MSVLARELESYQSALDQYRRQLSGYNKTVEAYNQSIFTDANGRPYVRDANGIVYYVQEDGKLSGASLPAGKIAGDYGATALPDNNNYFLMRQNPTQQNTRQVTGVRMVGYDDYGNVMYYGWEGDNYVNYSPNLYRVVSTQPGTNLGWENETPTITLATDASTYPDKPGDFTGKLRVKPPDPTLTQLRKLQQPGSLEQERGGLISNEIIGRGNNPYL